MRLTYRILIVSWIAVLCACTKPDPKASASPQLARPATIKDIMDSMVDPSGDFMFESIKEVADAKGVRQIAPETDEDWEKVREHVFILIEAPNLLTMEGRKVAQPGEKAKN